MKIGCGGLFVIIVLALFAYAANSPPDTAAKTLDRPFDPQSSPSRLTRLVKQYLRDPDSAVVTVVAPGCGLVNSRNGFGGMSGNMPFIVYPDDRVWFQEAQSKGFRSEWRKRCQGA